VRSGCEPLGGDRPEVDTGGPIAWRVSCRHMPPVRPLRGLGRHYDPMARPDHRCVACGDVPAYEMQANRRRRIAWLRGVFPPPRSVRPGFMPRAQEVAWRNSAITDGTPLRHLR